MYYHLFLDSRSLSLLRKHAKKIKRIANTVEEWNGGKYGKVLRF